MIEPQPRIVDHYLKEHQDAYIAEETKKLKDFLLPLPDGTYRNYPSMSDAIEEPEVIEVPKAPEVPKVEPQGFGKFEFRKHSRTSDYRKD